MLQARPIRLRSFDEPFYGTLSANIPSEAWNADRLNSYLSQIDAGLSQANYERAVALSYTCFEGFLGAFVRAKAKRDRYLSEIIELSMGTWKLAQETPLRREQRFRSEAKSPPNSFLARKA